MGQNALAVVYGVPVDEKMFNSLREDPSDDDSDLDDVFGRMEMGTDGDCLGVCVGTSIYAEDGERELEGVIPVTSLESYLSKEINAAKTKWAEVASYAAKKKGVTLPEPSLMLVTVERA